MAINKRKILESAQKHLQRGALDKALEDYRVLLKADPHDANVLLKIGDLYLKQGKRDEAINAYLRVAQQFTREGFDAKAVALYKQISRLDPKRQDVAVPLAELYARMGLVSDAIAALQGAADSAYRAGDKDGALELLRRMAALDPANTQNRLKVAELLAQEGRRDEALSEYDAVAEELERRGEDEERIRVLERALAIDPQRSEALLEVARAKLRAGQFANAQKLAERLLAAQPDDVDGRELLAHALHGEGQEERARETFRELAELFRLRGDEGRARDLMQRFGGLEALAPEDSDAPIGGELPLLELGDDDSGGDFLLEDEPAPPPPPAPAPSAAVAEPKRAPAPPPVAAPAVVAKAASPESEESDPEQFLAEAAVYLRYGKHERAVTALRAILAQVPDHRQALESLGEALAALGETAHAVTALQRAAAGARDAGDAEGIARVRERLTRLDAAAAAALAPAEPESDTAGSLDAPGFEIDLDLEGALETVDEPTLAAAGAPEPFTLDLDGLDETPGAAPEPESSPTGSAWASEPTPEESTASTPGRVAADLEEAEFYFEQGLLDEAHALYERILAAAPSHPQALLRLGELAARSGAPIPEPTAPEPAPRAAARRVPPVAAPSPPEPVAAEDPSFELDLDDEPSPPEPVAAEDPSFEFDLDDEPAPTAPEPAPAPHLSEAEVTRPGFAAAPAAPGDFDLAAELSGAIGGDEPSLRTLAGTEEEGFEQVFHAFKSGIERELGDGDHEARYDLGIAYKEMGLLEDAIAAFQIAMRAPERQLASLHMMGLCALELGRAADAVAHLEQALSLPGLPDDQRVPLRYDAGRAYAAVGDKGRARAAFEEVRAADPSFGDLARELAALDAVPDERPDAEPDGEPFESFDGLLSDGPADAQPAARYESFDDLFADEPEDEAAAPPAAAAESDLEEPEPELTPAESEPAEIEAPEAAAPEPAQAPEPEPPAAPVPAPAARKRRKISFV